MMPKAFISMRRLLFIFRFSLHLVSSMFPPCALGICESPPRRQWPHLSRFIFHDLSSILESSSPDFPNISRPQGDHHISGMQPGYHFLRNLIFIRHEGDIFVAVNFDGPIEPFPIHARNRLFSGRIDVQQKENIRLIKSSWKFLYQISGAGIPVRLEYSHEHPAAACVSGCAQCGRNFRRVMSVVVHDQDFPFSPLIWNRRCPAF